jgi:Zn-finger nucleic acid-binding protein
MQCPRCQTTLEEHRLDEVRVHDCPLCGGTWFTESALREAKDDAVPDLDWMDVELWRHERVFRLGEKRLGCPSCGKRMGSLVYGETGVEIDHCPQCRGVWLDRDEFRRVLVALRGEAAGLRSVRSTSTRNVRARPGAPASSTS